MTKLRSVRAEANAPCLFAEVVILTRRALRRSVTASYGAQENQHDGLHYRGTERKTQGANGANESSNC